MNPSRRTFLLGGAFALASLAAPSLEGCTIHVMPHPSSRRYEIENVFDEMSRRPDAIVSGITPDEAFTDVSLIEGFDGERYDKARFTDPSLQGDKWYSGGYDVSRGNTTCSILFQYSHSTTIDSYGTSHLDIEFESPGRLNGYSFSRFEIFYTPSRDPGDRLVSVDFYFDEDKEEQVEQAISDVALSKLYIQLLTDELLEPYFAANPGSIFSIEDYGRAPTSLDIHGLNY